MPLPESQPFDKERALSQLATTSNAAEKQQLMKTLVGIRVAEQIQRLPRTKNEVLGIGLGTGSTAEAAILAIGAFMQDGRISNINAISSSKRSIEAAKRVGIPTFPFNEFERVAYTFDGADEVEFNPANPSESTFNIIKGGGGAMTIERRLALKSDHWAVIVDESKLVPTLGNFPVAVEVHPDAIENVQAKMQEFAGPEWMIIRTKKEGGIWVTDLGNHIVDVKMRPGSIQPEWEDQIREFPGVIDTGLFMDGYPNEVIVSRQNGTIEEFPAPGIRPQARSTT